jgi:LAO/AO transport system kinase
MRIGISGAPGAGKSSFIEALGLILVGRGRQVAVLAVDPSSSLSGGSVLGDKTRMVRLAAHPLAFIRPSPSGGTLGGVAAKTREAIFLCEAAGFDVVVVETIGVGQSEVAVADMTDLFVLLQLPNTGDELQAIKKGALELAQLILINKADLDPPAAQRAQAQIEAGLRLVAVPRAGGAIDPPPVLRVSALRGDGIAEVWQAVEALFTRSASNGDLAARRRAQSVAWLWQQIEVGLMQRFRAHPQVRVELAALQQAVSSGVMAASVAARRLLAAAHDQAGGA